MAFQTADRRLGLRNGLGYRVVCRIRGVEPYTGIGIENPVPPTLGIAKFRLERPTVKSPIDELPRSVLSRWCHHLDARAQNDLLPPFGELLGLHCGATQQVYRGSGREVQQAGTVHGSVRAEHASAKGSHPIGQGDGEVRGSSENAECVVETDRRDAERTGRSLNRNCAVKIEPAIVEGPCQIHRARMQRRYEVGARSEILGDASPTPAAQQGEEYECLLATLCSHRCGPPKQALEELGVESRSQSQACTGQIDRQDVGTERICQRQRMCQPGLISCARECKLATPW